LLEFDGDRRQPSAVGCVGGGVAGRPDPLGRPARRSDPTAMRHRSRGRKPRRQLADVTPANDGRDQRIEAGDGGRSAVRPTDHGAGPRTAERRRSMHRQKRINAQCARFVPAHPSRTRRWHEDRVARTGAPLRSIDRRDDRRGPGRGRFGRDRSAKAARAARLGVEVAGQLLVTAGGNPAGSAGCALKPPSHSCVVLHRCPPAPAALIDADRRRCPAPPRRDVVVPGNQQQLRIARQLGRQIHARRTARAADFPHRRSRRHSPAWVLRGCSVGARMFPTRDGFLGRSQDSAPQANRPLATQATIMAWTSLCVSGLSGRVVA
jgi:hypothetical protein